MNIIFRSATILTALSIGGLKIAEQSFKFKASRITKAWKNHSYISEYENDIRIYMLDGISTKTKVILVHGVGHSSVSMAGMGEYIHRSTGATVIRFDRPGYGNSRFLSAEPRSIQQSVTELCGIINKYCSHKERLIIIGHSLGGLITRLALEECDSYPNITAVLIDPTHPHEVVNDRSKRMGMVLAAWELDRRMLLSCFGGELLDESHGRLLGSPSDTKYEKAIRFEKFTARNLWATKKEAEAAFCLLANGKFFKMPKPRHDIHVLGSEQSDALAGAPSLFKSYINTEAAYQMIAGTDHESVLYDRQTLNHITQRIKGGSSLV